MEVLFKIMYFLVAMDPQYKVGFIRDELLGIGAAESSVFVNTLLLSLGTALLMAMLFYLLLNRVATLNKMWLWVLLGLIVSGICFGISQFQIGNQNGIYPNPEPIEALGWKFIGMSAFWGFIYYYLFSLALKNFSIYAKRLPH